jgi:hypothetical protein
MDEVETNRSERRNSIKYSFEHPDNEDKENIRMKESAINPSQNTSTAVLLSTKSSRLVALIKESFQAVATVCLRQILQKLYLINVTIQY